MNEPADVVMGGERIKYGLIAYAWFKGAEPDTVFSHRVCPHGGERGEYVGESMPRIAIERQVAAGDYDFPVTGRKERLCSGKNLPKRDRAWLAAK